MNRYFLCVRLHRQGKGGLGEGRRRRVRFGGMLWIIEWDRQT